MPQIYEAAQILLFWWAALSAARICWCIAGRAFGFYNPETFRSWLRLWVPWRWAYLNLWLPLAYWREEMFQHGKVATARLAGPLERMAHVYKPGDIYLGRFRAAGLNLFQPVGVSGDSGKHLCMVAGTGSGKTTHLMTMLALHEGTAFVIDPKGQIANGIARRMGEGGGAVEGKGMKVCILDPSRQVSGHDDLRACWNPFDELQRAKARAIAAGRNPDDAVVSFAMKFAEGLIVKSKDPFWSGAAKEFLHSVILHIESAEPRERQTLARLYELVTVGLPELVSHPKETGFDALLRVMSLNPAYGIAIPSGATALMGGSRETVGSVTMTFREQLKWLKLPAMREITAASDFSVEELKTGNLVLFVCAKAGEIREDFPGWFRLLTVMALQTFEDIPGSLKHPCLFALDEFPSLGKIDRVEVAAPLLRSAGVRLLIIIQNIGQLAGGQGAPPLYDNWETFPGNSECCWWMGTNHRDNLEYLERKLAKRTVKTRVSSITGGPQRIDYKEREVMTADQIERFLGRGNVIVTRGKRAFALAQDPYFKALPVTAYSPDPNYAESVGRVLARGFFKKRKPFVLADWKPKWKLDRAKGVQMPLRAIGAWVVVLTLLYVGYSIGNIGREAGEQSAQPQAAIPFEADNDDGFDWGAANADTGVTFKRRDVASSAADDAELDWDADPYARPAKPVNPELEKWNTHLAQGPCAVFTSIESAPREAASVGQQRQCLGALQAQYPEKFAALGWWPTVTGQTTAGDIHLAIWSVNGVPGAGLPGTTGGAGEYRPPLAFVGARPLLALSLAMVGCVLLIGAGMFGRGMMARVRTNAEEMKSSVQAVSRRASTSERSAPAVENASPLERDV